MGATTVVPVVPNTAEQLKQRIIDATEREQSLVVEILSLMPTITDECRNEVLGYLDKALHTARKSAEQSSSEYKRVVLDRAAGPR